MQVKLAVVAALLAVVQGQAMGQTPVPAPPTPIVDVYTMGAGEELFTRFGHAAICVTDADSPEGRCYNYGTADFSTPGPLTVGIVRGNAVFWVSVVSQPRMMAWYMRQDRTVYRQRLPYDPRLTPWLVQALHRADVRSATFYHYHHFNDNCTTRIRDLLDNALGQVQSPSWAQATRSVANPPLRHYVDQGLAGRPLLLAISTLFLGRAIDAPSTRWHGMFLPEILRAEVKSRFGAEPELLYARQAPLSTDASRRAGTYLLVGLGALLAAGVLLGARLGRPRLGLYPTAAVLGFVGLFLTALVLFSPLAELRYNEALLLCWPTDLLLPILSWKTARRYAALRLSCLLVCGLAATVGLLIQPLVGPCFLGALPLFAVYYVSRRASS